MVSEQTHLAQRMQSHTVTLVRLQRGQKGAEERSVPHGIINCEGHSLCQLQQMVYCRLRKCSVIRKKTTLSTHTAIPGHVG